MNITERTSIIRNPARKPAPFHRRGAAVFSLFLPVCPVLAQNVLWSPPQTPAAPAAVQEHENSSPMQVFAPLENIPAQLLQWGPVSLHPHVDYQFSYGNGIESSPGQSQNTVVQQVSPGMLFNWGDHWTLDYTPTLDFYSSSAFRNTVDQSVQLGWGTAYGDWFLSASQGFLATSDPNVVTAGQNDQQTYSTAFNAAYQFNDKMSLNAGLSQSFNYIGTGTGPTNLLQNLGSYRGWSTMDWFNYQFWPRFTAGLGTGFGYNQQDNSPDSIYEQYQAQANWRATDKISFQLSGGLEDQQYLSGGANDLLTPIFSAAIQYQPFEQTKVSVSASRTVSPAYYQNQTSESTGITGDLNQRLLGKLYLDLSGGYSTDKYVASTTGLAASRKDNIYSFSARLSYSPLKRTTVSAFYAYSKDASSQAGFTSASGYGYSSSQVGFEIGYQY